VAQTPINWEKGNVKKERDLGAGTLGITLAKKSQRGRMAN